VPVEHYENFPVASLLCPAALRPAIEAIYAFARTADDFADEGDASPSERLAALAAYRAGLAETAAGRPASAWPGVFVPLGAAITRHRLPVELLDALLDAFIQDVTVSRYADRPALLDYCRRSANPVGRLLLGLYGVADPASLRRSDAICSALQLINFWQDFSRDGPNGRLYVPQADLDRHGVPAADVLACRDSPAARALIEDLCAWARDLMREGAPLAPSLPGRAGWELRLVVQGGLLILDKIAAGGHDSLLRRPAVTAGDVPRLVWRALTMRATP